jgi:hypothetical protein
MFSMRFKEAIAVTHEGQSRRSVRFSLGTNIVAVIGRIAGDDGKQDDSLIIGREM